MGCGYSLGKRYEEGIFLGSKVIGPTLLRSGIRSTTGRVYHSKRI